jgi:hypothetical protein
MTTFLDASMTLHRCKRSSGILYTHPQSSIASDAVDSAYVSVWDFRFPALVLVQLVRHAGCIEARLQHARLTPQTKYRRQIVQFSQV